MSDVRRTLDEPHDAATDIANEALKAIEHHEGAKVAVMVQLGERGGVGLHGYDDETDAMVEIFLHLKAIFEANGKTLGFMPMPGSG